MGIAQSVAAWLKRLGHDAVHLNDEKLFNLPDHLILAKAISENRIILTTDMDFGQLLAISKVDNVSVIQFRISDFRSDQIRSHLTDLFDNFSDRLVGYFIITVQDGRKRFRKLPM
jgi:predicted nuclease of predicted toxin-antitoxin system